MRPVPISKEMVPSDIPHAVKVIGPAPGESILDDDAAMPVEALILEDGFHIRVALEDGDLKSLAAHPFVHLIFRSTQVPVFWIGPELDVLQ